MNEHLRATRGQTDPVMSGIAAGAAPIGNLPTPPDRRGGTPAESSSSSKRY